MNNKEKILEIQYLIQRAITKEGEEQWVNLPMSRDLRRGVVHTQARKLRKELVNQTTVKIRVVKVVVYHDQDF